MSVYLLVNFGIIIVPLLLSFERRVFYYKKWPTAFRAIGFVAILYLLWDVWATSVGHWWFNPRYVLSFKFFFLPIEEILFFVTAPFSCLFIYEVVGFFHPDSQVRINPKMLWIVCFVALITGLMTLSKGYTALSFLSLAFFLFVAVKYGYAFIATKNFWIYIAICYVPFSIVNGILTGLPVVQYSSSAILGFRVGTIPIEDFIYNFSLLGFVAIVYQHLRSQKSKS